MNKSFRSLWAAALFVGGAVSAHAGLVGSTVNVKFYYPDTGTLYCDSGNALVVNPGVEYPTGCPGFEAVSIDFFDSGFTVVHSNASFADGAFTGFVVDVINGADFSTVEYAGGTLGVTSAAASGGDLFINFAGQKTGTANFRFTQGASAVPEPATLGLAGLALAALGAARRKRRA